MDTREFIIELITGQQLGRITCEMAYEAIQDTVSKEFSGRSIVSISVPYVYVSMLISEQIAQPGSNKFSALVTSVNRSLKNDLQRSTSAILECQIAIDRSCASLVNLYRQKQLYEKWITQLSSVNAEEAIKQIEEAGGKPGAFQDERNRWWLTIGFGSYEDIKFGSYYEADICISNAVLVLKDHKEASTPAIPASLKKVVPSYLASLQFGPITSILKKFFEGRANEPRVA